MVRRYAHISVKHLQPYADRLTFQVTPDVGGLPPIPVGPEGHKNGHRGSRQRLHWWPGLM
jgi:hypothetical protein